MSKLIYQAEPVVVLATNTFINVPIVLQFDDTPLISVVREQNLGFTTEIPIYHEDGTYLAKVRGTRVYATEDGKKAGLEIRQFSDAWACEINGRTVFEVKHQPAMHSRRKRNCTRPKATLLRQATRQNPNYLTHREMH